MLSENKLTLDHGHDHGQGTVRSGTVQYERSRSRTKNETFTVFTSTRLLLFNYTFINSYKAQFPLNNMNSS